MAVNNSVEKKVMQQASARKTIFIFLLLIALPMASFAQAPAPAAGGEQKSSVPGGPRKQLATIIFAGLGGAILGLSTLSFYGRPQDNLKNIAIGGAFGVIVGTGFVTYKAATNPSELYSAKPQIERDQELLSRQPVVAHAAPLGLQFTFEFE